MGLMRAVTMFVDILRSTTVRSFGRSSQRICGHAIGGWRNLSSTLFVVLLCPQIHGFLDALDRRPRYTIFNIHYLIHSFKRHLLYLDSLCGPRVDLIDSVPLNLGVGLRSLLTLPESFVSSRNVTGDEDTGHLLFALLPSPLVCAPDILGCPHSPEPSFLP